MKLYLVQHGEAVAKHENPDRPLTEKGRKDVQRMAAFLARSGVRVARVIHSGRTRARETAVLLAQIIGPGRVVEEAESGLAPDDSTDELAAAVARLGENLMVVGHQPSMGRMVARLVAGRDDPDLLAFEPGAVACLERRPGDGGWVVDWMVGPRLLGQ